MDGDLAARVAALLEAEADDDAADRARKHVTTIRGVRGVPAGALARIVAVLAATPPALPADADALGRTFGQAWEDGLVAIGLLSVADADPAEVLDVGLAWAERVDDVGTADALGWLVIGPSALGAADGLDRLLRLRQAPRPHTRRVAVASALAWTPEVVEGPAAAALRAKLGVPHVRMVDAPLDEPIARIGARFARDEAPEVQKAMRRLIRVWAAIEPARVVRWAGTVPGGLPKLLGAEVNAARAAVGRVAG